MYVKIWLRNSDLTTALLDPLKIIIWVQTLMRRVEQGRVRSRVVVEVVKIIDQTQVTRPRGESRSTSTLIITHFRVPKRVKMASRQVFDEKGSPVKLFSQVCMGELNEGG